MQKDDKRRSSDTKFIIVGASGKGRKKAIEKIKLRWPALEVFAPVEREMVRPRRKSSKRKAQFVERPLFYEYLALGGIPEGEANELFRFEDLWFVLTDPDGKPAQVSFLRLRGMRVDNKTIGWEGRKVQFIHGPLAGKVGTFNSDTVMVEMLGRKVKVQASVFDLVRVR
jgi:hypothetical protein